jgi:hypothetical protein
VVSIDSIGTTGYPSSNRKEMIGAVVKPGKTRPSALFVMEGLRYDGFNKLPRIVADAQDESTAGR